MKAILQVLVALLALKMIVRAVRFLRQHFLMRRLDLLTRYGGKGTYAVITGASRGQGRQFALQLATIGFHLVLIGSSRTLVVLEEIRQAFPTIQTRFLRKDFSHSFQEGFFDDIQVLFQELPISLLINNVGYRSGNLDYRKLPVVEMKKSIAVGTLVQAVLVQFALRKFTLPDHPVNCGIVNITAQCLHHTDLLAMSPEISLPYLSVYEASNAFGFFHSNSVYHEVRDRFPHVDYLTITPGAVLTDTTRHFLSESFFSVTDVRYVSNVLDLLGNQQGIRCAYTGHGITDYLINLFPIVKERVLQQVGATIAGQLEIRA